MATCKDCIHSDLCGTFTRPCMPDEANASERLCQDFKNRADFVEVKHGEWIYNVKYYSCSICAGKRFNLLLGTDAEYCPYCGAKMDGERK